ncbi:hypothetical protein C8R45DRAFT_934204 [Mycena sanguinolenta]|nr:hypothetical protein C8R45DRAFT_934204 [Mycena sanguinolenta]
MRPQHAGLPSLPLLLCAPSSLWTRDRSMETKPWIQSRDLPPNVSSSSKPNAFEAAALDMFSHLAAETSSSRPPELHGGSSGQHSIGRIKVAGCGLSAFTDYGRSLAIELSELQDSSSALADTGVDVRPSELHGWQQGLAWHWWNQRLQRDRSRDLAVELSELKNSSGALADTGRPSELHSGSSGQCGSGGIKVTGCRLNCGRLTMYDGLPSSLQLSTIPLHSALAVQGCCSPLGYSWSSVKT